MGEIESDPENDRDCEIEEPEEAFRGSDEHEWKGVKLHKYSFLRETAAEMLGLQWGVTLTPANMYTLENPKYTALREAREKLESMVEHIQGNGGSTGGTAYAFGYDQQKAIVDKLEKDLGEEAETTQLYKGISLDAAIVLWLCHQPDSKCHKARRRPRDFEAEIDRWADENGILDGMEAISLFVRIVNHVSSSTGTPDIGKSGSNNDPN